MKVVIAIDDSPNSHHMLDLVGRRHWSSGTEFKIVHVLEPISTKEWAGDGWLGMHKELTRRRHKYAEQLCSEARLKLEKHVPNAIVHFEIREGRPQAEIIFAATEWDANKIVIGAHSREVCPHNQLGSVSRGVAERSSCSVEILRPCVKPHHERVMTTNVAPARTTLCEIE
jgi:nucleotide-binding universal stress UspA family protein